MRKEDRRELSADEIEEPKQRDETERFGQTDETGGLEQKNERDGRYGQMLFVRLKVPFVSNLLRDEFHTVLYGQSENSLKRGLHRNDREVSENLSVILRF